MKGFAFEFLGLLGFLLCFFSVGGYGQTCTSCTYTIGVSGTNSNNYSPPEGTVCITGSGVFKGDLNLSGNSTTYIDVEVPAVAVQEGIWRVYPNPANGQPVKIALLRTSAYQEGPIHYRVFNPLYASKIKQATSLDALNIGLSELISGFSGSLLVVQIQWDNQVEFVKIVR